MATAFTLYNAAKRSMMKGTLDLDANLTCGLYKSSSNAATTALVLVGSFTNVMDSAGYKGANALGAITITLSGDAARLDCSNTIFSASGSFTSCMYLVVFSSFSGVGNQAVCWSQLSASAFSVTDTNTLTIQFNAAGLFNLT